MANSVFLDTNGWVALLNSRDILHERADNVWRDLGRRNYRIVVTDWVIAETGNGLARSGQKGAFVEAARRTLESSNSQVVYVDSDLLQNALAHYAQRGDKSWGLVDCASFIVMQRLGVTDAMTNDKHFEQAGFACLL